MHGMPVYPKVTPPPCISSGFPYNSPVTIETPGGERGTVWVKRLAQEHNAITRSGLEPRPLAPESTALTTGPQSSS